MCGSHYRPDVIPSLTLSLSLSRSLLQLCIFFPISFQLDSPSSAREELHTRNRRKIAPSGLRERLTACHETGDCMEIYEKGERQEKRNGSKGGKRKCWSRGGWDSPRVGEMRGMTEGVETEKSWRNERYGWRVRAGKVRWDLGCGGVRVIAGPGTLRYFTLRHNAVICIFPRNSFTRVTPRLVSCWNERAIWQTFGGRGEGGIWEMKGTRADLSCWRIVWPGSLLADVCIQYSSEREYVGISDLKGLSWTKKDEVWAWVCSKWEKGVRESRSVTA